MKAVPFLMFQGDAKAALALWREAFPELELLDMQEHPGGPQAGQVAAARMRLGGSEWRLYDSPPVHAFSFTPSTSIFVDCDDEAHLRRLADTLGEGGSVMMPIDDYGFSTLFTWIADRFGVSWQLNLP
ncbi:MAG: VOC family protein [Sphingomonadales bacterium]|nr:VOC family protein [Sphingomonadales bacterium]